MTPPELRTALSAANLTQREFARRVDVAPQTVQRWVKGERPIPGWVPVMFAAWRDRDAAVKEAGE